MPYTAGVTRVTKTKAGLAAEVQALLAGYLFARKDAHMQVLQQLGLTPGHMKALFELDPNVPVPMGALADTLVCDASSATWIVDRLEERGLVERGAHPKDRRVKTVVLTREGAKTKALLVERLLDPPPELEALDQSDLEALRDALQRLPQSPPFWASIAQRQGTGGSAEEASAAGG